MPYREKSEMCRESEILSSKLWYRSPTRVICGTLYITFQVKKGDWGKGVVIFLPDCPNSASYTYKWILVAWQIDWWRPIAFMSKKRRISPLPWIWSHSGKMNWIDAACLFLNEQSSLLIITFSTVTFTDVGRHRSQSGQPFIHVFVC